MESPRVYLVSDVRLYREGLTSCLAVDGRLTMIGAGSGTDAVAQIKDLSPDVMLLDLAAHDSLRLPRLAIAAVAVLRVVAFAVAEAAADVLACAEAGICGFIPKDASVEDVVTTVLRALSGEVVCSPRITAMLFQRLASLSTENGPAPSLLELTRREREIANLISRGLPNKVIARELHLGPATIKNHVHNILQKLSLQRRGEIGALWLHSGLAATTPADQVMQHLRPSY